MNAIMIDGVEVTEEQVCAWMTKRLEQIRTTGMPAHHLQVSVGLNNSGELYAMWNMHAAGDCVVGHTSSASAELKLRSEVFGDPERKAREKRELAAKLIAEAEALEGIANKKGDAP